MNGNVENLVLEHLRAIRAGMGRMEAQLVEVNARLLSVEKAVLKSRSDNLDTQEDVYSQQIQYDRLAERVGRIEKRLELCD